jgi:hypothetical protein
MASMIRSGVSSNSAASLPIVTSAGPGYRSMSHASFSIPILVKPNHFPMPDSQIVWPGNGPCAEGHTVMSRLSIHP